MGCPAGVSCGELLFEKVEEAVFVFVKEAEAIKFLLQFVSFRAVIASLLEELFEMSSFRRSRLAFPILAGWVFRGLGLFGFDGFDLFKRDA